MHEAPSTPDGATLLDAATSVQRIARGWLVRVGSVAALMRTARRWQRTFGGASAHSGGATSSSGTRAAVRRRPENCDWMLTLEQTKAAQPELAAAALALIFHARAQRSKGCQRAGLSG